MSIERNLRYDWYRVPPLLRTRELYFLLEVAYLQSLPVCDLEHAWGDDALWVKILMVQNKIANDLRVFFEKRCMLPEDQELRVYNGHMVMCRLSEYALYFYPSIPALSYYLDLLLGTPFSRLFGLDWNDVIVFHGRDYSLVADRWQSTQFATALN